MVREGDEAQRSFQRLRGSMKEPFKRTYPLERAVSDIVAGFEARKRRICSPRFVVLAHWLRPLLATAAFERDQREAAPRSPGCSKRARRTGRRGRLDERAGRRAARSAPAKRHLLSRPRRPSGELRRAVHRRPRRPPGEHRRAGRDGSRRGGGARRPSGGGPVVRLERRRATRAWQRETIVNAFSVGKAFAGLSLLMLVSRGAAGLDDPVARHWPEFSAAGKEEVTCASSSATVRAWRRSARSPGGGAL